MQANYRLIHFLPNPTDGSKVPIAALVHWDERFAIAHAQNLPSAECLRSLAVSEAMHMILERLQAESATDVLPANIGPHAVLGDAHQIPAGVRDPVAWVTAHILPVALAHQDQATDKSQRTPARKAWGRRFFEAMHVAKHVRDNFRAEHHFFKGSPTPAGGRLNPVTHWVEGRGVYLLMEPVVPARSSFEEDLQSINTNFAAYSFTAEHYAEVATTATLIAYILPGGAEGHRYEAMSVLRDKAEVLDMAVLSEREHFAKRIRALAEPQSFLQ